MKSQLSAPEGGCQPDCHPKGNCIPLAPLCGYPFADSRPGELLRASAWTSSLNPQPKLNTLSQAVCEKVNGLFYFTRR